MSEGQQNTDRQQTLNIQTLNCFYEAEAAYLYANGFDFSAIAATLHPEVVIFQPASLPYGGTWRGLAGFERWMQEFAKQWSSMEVRGSELFPCDDVIISKSNVYAKTRSTGREIDWPLLQYFRFREGKIIELWPFYWDTATLTSRFL